MQMPQGTSITWLGHAAFRIGTPTGKTIYIDPWLDNPRCPPELKQVDRADAILVTHGHFDHVGNTVDIAKKTSAQVVCIHEVSVYLGAQGVQNVIGMNKGGTVEVAGIRATMVSADHSSGLSGEHGIICGGASAGFVVELENGFKLYHAGDTNVMSDMRIIGELYRPDLALLPIGGHYTMAPREAAYAARLLGVKSVLPMHYGTFPILAGTPAALQEELKGAGIEVVELSPGGTLR